MAKHISAICLISICLLACTLPLRSAQKVLTVVVCGPMVVAFFAPLTKAELNEDGSNESLADFQFYTRQVRLPLSMEGIDFSEVYAQSFRVHIGARTNMFRAVDVGYYFIAPGKKPHVEYGVMTDTNLLEVAKKYFVITPK